MLYVEGNAARIEGEHPRDLCAELTLLLSAFRDTLVKEYQVSEEEVNMAVGESVKVAFMSPLERKQHLDNLVEDYKNKHERI